MRYTDPKEPFSLAKKLALGLVLASITLATSTPAQAFPVEYVGRKPESILVVTSCDPPMGDLKTVQEKTFNKLGARLSESELRRFLPFADSSQLSIPISWATFGDVLFAKERQTIIGRLAQNKDGSFCPVYIVMHGQTRNSNQISPLSKADFADPFIQSALMKMTKHGVKICKYRHKVNGDEFERGSYPPFGETQLNFCDLVGRYGDEVLPEAVRMGITLARLRTDTENYVLLADDNMAIFIELGVK
jgi:hypothetical protein